MSLKNMLLLKRKMAIQFNVHFYYSFDMFEIVYKQKYLFQHIIKNADAKVRQALFNCADILFYLNFHCKLQPILLWSIVKRNPR